MSNKLQTSIDQNSQYVGFLVRISAFIIDNILLLLVIIPPIIVMYGTEYFLSSDTIYGTPERILLYGIPLVLTVIFWAYKAATPGKMVMKVHIVDAISGEEPTLFQSFVRYLGYYISLLPFGLGFLWIIWDKKKQGWHDKMAGTVVIKRLSEK